jgi:hypothetical protein
MVNVSSLRALLRERRVAAIVHCLIAAVIVVLNASSMIDGYAQSAPVAQPPPVDWGLFRSAPAWQDPRETPESHDQTWWAEHGMHVSEQDCTSCHSESECATCHAGQSVPSAFHGAGYALLHAAEASRDAASCASCHSVSQFCRDCHTTSAVDVDSAFLAPGVDAHPPGWSLPGDPSHHGDAARRDLVSCVSCHNDQSCTTCHADISPHGGDFWSRCANLQRQSPDMCAQCHVANTPRCGMP